jgi:hypothetical protein
MSEDIDNEIAKEPRGVLAHHNIVMLHQVLPPPKQHMRRGSQIPIPVTAPSDELLL